jgi:tryptophan synthase alpha chain
LKFYSERNQLAWQRIQEQYETFMIGYLIAGDPTSERSSQIIENALLAGIDILELGVPSRNPYLDGEIIQTGHARVEPNIKNWLIEYWKMVRKRVQKPIWAMSYKADLFQTGIYQQLVTNQLVDTLLLPDCSVAERNQVAMEVKDYGIDVVQFIQPSMSDQEMESICSHSNIIYAQTYTGATGSILAISEDLSGLFKKIRAYTTALIVAGFGLKTPANVRAVVESNFNGAVVGSALVECCAYDRQDKLYELISEMKKETDLYQLRG